jgi:hypothetical protein
VQQLPGLAPPPFPLLGLVQPVAGHPGLVAWPAAACCVCPLVPRHSRVPALGAQPSGTLVRTTQTCGSRRQQAAAGGSRRQQAAAGKPSHKPCMKHGCMPHPRMPNAPAPLLSPSISDRRHKPPSESTWHRRRKPAAQGPAAEACRPRTSLLPSQPRPADQRRDAARRAAQGERHRGLPRTAARLCARPSSPSLLPSPRPSLLPLRVSRGRLVHPRDAPDSEGDSERDA